MCGDPDRDRDHFAAASASQQRPFAVRPTSTPTGFYSHEVRRSVMEVQGGIEHLLGMYRAGMEAEAALRSMGIDPNNPNKGTEQTPAKREARLLSKGDRLDGRVIGLRNGKRWKVVLDGVEGNYEACIYPRGDARMDIGKGGRVRLVVSHVTRLQRTTQIELDLVGVLSR